MLRICCNSYCVVQYWKGIVQARETEITLQLRPGYGGGINTLPPEVGVRIPFRRINQRVAVVILTADVEPSSQIRVQFSGDPASMLRAKIFKHRPVVQLHLGLPSYVIRECAAIDSCRNPFQSIHFLRVKAHYVVIGIMLPRGRRIAPY